MNKINKMESVALHHGYEGRGWCPIVGENMTMRDKVWSPIVGESGTDPRTGMRSQRLLGSDSTVLQACVLGLSLQGLEFQFRIVRLLRCMRLLNPFAA